MNNIQRACDQLLIDLKKIDEEYKNKILKIKRTYLAMKIGLFLLVCFIIIKIMLT